MPHTRLTKLKHFVCRHHFLSSSPRLTYSLTYSPQQQPCLCSTDHPPLHLMLFPPRTFAVNLCRQSASKRSCVLSSPCRWTRDDRSVNRFAVNKRSSHQGAQAGVEAAVEARAKRHQVTTVSSFLESPRPFASMPRRNKRKRG